MGDAKTLARKHRLLYKNLTLFANSCWIRPVALNSGCNLESSGKTYFLNVNTQALPQTN